MAEFLIKAVDASHPDSAKDARGCYKRGDIVEVYEDGICTRQPAAGSKMVIVKVPGFSKEQAMKYMEPHIEIQGDVTVTMRRRRFRLRVDDLPSGIKQTLKDDGWITVSVAQAKSFIRNKITNLDEG